MNKKAVNNHRLTLTPILFSILYTTYFYAVIMFMVNQNLFVRGAITLDNVIAKLTGDFFIMLLVPIILIIIYRKRLSSFNLLFNNTYLQYILITIYIILFILHGDFTTNGIYKFFFYLVVVAFGEEVIYRGYVYNTLKRQNKALAIIASGFFSVLCMQ